MPRPRRTRSTSGASQRLRSRRSGRSSLLLVQNAPLEPAGNEESGGGDQDDAARRDEPERADQLRDRLAEVVGQQPDQRRPDDPARGVPAEEAPPVHAREPRAPRRGDAEDGDEAPEE